ncbi:MAG: type II toxin-antitoxin system VapC family toxin [Gammaproteobacteria bacterium]|nr:type II toxin-antitoxin system VapC family toxin [Gammaproteobacteria bacterium]
MYLIDTNVLSELRKRKRAHAGVTAFFADATARNAELFVSALTIGELRRGVELIRNRGDRPQALRLEAWLATLMDDFDEHILPIDTDVAQMWGALRVPHHENALDKLIAATAAIHGLTVVTRNEAHFRDTRVPIINPFSV